MISTGEKRKKNRSDAALLCLHVKVKVNVNNLLAICAAGLTIKVVI